MTTINENVVNNVVNTDKLQPQQQEHNEHDEIDKQDQHEPNLFSYNKELIENNSNSNSMYSNIKPRQSIRNRRNINNNNENLSSYFKQILNNNQMNNINNNKNKILTLIQKTIISYLHYVNINKRLIIYLLLILIAGIIKDNNEIDIIDNNKSSDDEMMKIFYKFLYQYFRTSKKSLLNLYFVKLGWLWTLIVTIPFIIITRLIVIYRRHFDSMNLNKNSNNNKNKNYNTIDQIDGDNHQDNQDNKNVNQNNKSMSLLVIIKEFIQELLPPIIRILLSTIAWYFSVETFVIIERMTGHCQSNAEAIVYRFKNYNDCKKQGHHWINGIDISGHLFLMTFSNFIIIEELKYLFYKFIEFRRFYHRYIKLDKEQRLNNFIESYRFTIQSTIQWLILILTLMMFIIVTIWDFMMIQTMLFYHNLIQKLLGFIWSILMWLLIYKIIPSTLIEKLNVDYNQFENNKNKNTS